VEEGIVIPCPHCGFDLFSEESELPIPAEQVTLTLHIIGDLKISCVSCSEEVGEHIASVLNGYADLVEDVIPLSKQPYRLLRNFVKTVNSLLSLTRVMTAEKGGKLSREQAVKLRYGLIDGKRRSLQQVGNEVNLTKSRVGQILALSMRMLRHPSRSKLIPQSFWQSPDTVKRLLERAETAETELVQGRTIVADLTEELERRTADLTALTDRLIQQGIIRVEQGEALDLRLDQLGLRSRTFNALNRSGINTVRQVLSKSPFEIMAVRNFGIVSFQDLSERLKTLNIDVTAFWGDDYERWL